VEIVAAGTFDPTLILSRTNTTITEGASATNASFNIALSNAVLNGDGTDTVELTWTVTHITTSAADFTSTTGTVSFDDDEMLDLAEGFSVPIAADDLNEGSEQFSVQIEVTDSGGVTVDIRIGNAPIVMTLNDNAADATAVTIARDSGTQSSVAEAASASFTVTLSGGTSTAAVMVPWSVGADSDSMTMDVTEGDFDADNNNAADTSFPSGTLSINAGQSSGTIMVRTFADGTAESAEVFVLTLGASPSSTTRSNAVGVSSTAGSAAATIAMNAALSRTVNLSGPTTLAEGATSGNYTVSVSGSAPTADITVNWTIGTDSDANTVDAAAPISAAPPATRSPSRRPTTKPIKLSPSPAWRTPCRNPTKYSPSPSP